MEDQFELGREIDNLRRSIFRTKCGAGLLFICLGVGIFALWNRRVGTVDANELVLRDKAGNVVARLGQDSYSDTCLTLTSNHDASVASLCVDEGGGSVLDLHNLTEGSRAMLTPGFTIYEGTGKIRPGLMIHGPGDGSSNLVKIWLAPGQPKITVVGERQRVIWSSP
ncbi:MAG TPA: hypothetical protein VMF66_16495 [Candidatus Acidoferrum sp.]|nr:hypothetical protein [Candidatus Acidoferrum sp.]